MRQACSLNFGTPTPLSVLLLATLIPEIALTSNGINLRKQ
jgi:hypothetical protein